MEALAASQLMRATVAMNGAKRCGAKFRRSNAPRKRSANGYVGFCAWIYAYVDKGVLRLYVRASLCMVVCMCVCGCLYLYLCTHVRGWWVVTGQRARDKEYGIVYSSDEEEDEDGDGDRELTAEEIDALPLKERRGVGCCVVVCGRGRMRGCAVCRCGV